MSEVLQMLSTTTEVTIKNWIYLHSKPGDQFIEDIRIRQADLKANVLIHFGDEWSKTQTSVRTPGPEPWEQRASYNKTNPQMRGSSTGGPATKHVS